jgi:phosphopantothenoylcysteine decarboxylase/phosphopantothenate--cysteine ligase
MSVLKGKKVILGICGGIAAYKSLLLIRLLKKAGAEVKVIMTPAAKDFIGVLTASTLSENPVLSQMFHPETGEWANHVELGLWADVLLIAPATANTLSKMAAGQADSLLVSTYLSATCPVFFAPAMDLDMWAHPSTQANVKRLEEFGNHLIVPAEGPLASGLSGVGRMEEPENIFSFLENHFQENQEFKGKKILINLGPTQEAIDPVRYISNHSTGKMGHALVWEFARRGASLILITGPVSNQLEFPPAERIKVVSALEMNEACLSRFPEADIAVLTAAVADYRPEKVSNQKIKKTGEELKFRLVKNPDIASALGLMKKPGQFLLGFALETENEEVHAKEKLVRKNLDAIVLNSLSHTGAGFGHETNRISIMDRNGSLLTFETKSKKEVAKDIVDFISTQLA